MPSFATVYEVEATLQTVLTGGDMSFDCGTHGRAMSIRTRLNNWRARARKQNEDIYEVGHPLRHATVYDNLSMRVPPKTAPDAHVLYITRHGPLVARRLDGQPMAVLKPIFEDRKGLINPTDPDALGFDIVPEK